MKDHRATRIAEIGKESDGVDQLAWLALHGTTVVDESVRRRENLLAASAAASRLLLQAPDVMAAVPDVLEVIGEAAGVDRVDLMLAQTGPAGEHRLVVASEWAADGVFPRLGHSVMGHCDERNFSDLCSELRAGRSVCLDEDRSSAVEAYLCGGLHGIGTKTNAIVPIFVDSEFAGVVTFDVCREHRAIGRAELSALETAAGVIGAALHRERLVDAVRRERERVANERAKDATHKYTALLHGLEQLTGEVALDQFLSGQLLMGMTRYVGAVTGTVIMRDAERREWRVIAHVRDGHVEPPPYPASLPLTVALPFGVDAAAVHADGKSRPIYFDLTRDDCIEWPGMAEHHRREGHAGLLVLPLLFGQRTVGIMALSFRPNVPDRLPRTEELVGLAQGATVAIELARLATSSRDAAVLAERNRIGQEIHDGLAQVFTGILMQLGAAEELDAAASEAFRPQLLARIRDLAREGLAEARRSVMALRPEQTRRNGLELALRQLAARSTVPGRMTSTFEGGGLATGLPPEHEHELLRIAQEAVSNAVRHGKPQTVRLAMLDEETHWVLSVADDGCGLQQPPELSAQEGFGLASMRERAHAIGGEWHIDSALGAGTRVSVRLPKRGVA
ncbi:MAG TPA: GAF domain-containing sensor histidine kinase [Gammaproteobacteria bacterium]|nr:GAF domain-containing sensor histidine kinase [Gammaproteobacteria bacterium]